MKMLIPLNRVTPAAAAFTFALIQAAAGAQTIPPPTSQPAQPEERPLEYVLIETSKGPIVLELNREKAPRSVANFLRYVETDFYEGTIFHRVMKGFMIQGGGLIRSMVPKQPFESIESEAGNGLKNLRGTVAMARTNDPDSATSQFFINTVDNTGLDQTLEKDNHGYTVFGKVVAGMRTVDAIENLTTTTIRGRENVPIEQVAMIKVTLLTHDKAKEKIVEIERGR